VTSGVIASHIKLSSKVVILEVRDLALRFLLISTREIYFETSSLGTSEILASHIQRSSEVRDLALCVLLISMTKIYLRTPGFRTSGVFSSHIHLSSEVVIPEVRDLAPCVLLISMAEIYFGTSSFGSYEMHNTTNLPKCHIYRHLSTSINGPYGLLVFWSFLLNTSYLLSEYEIVEYRDHLTRVPHIDRQTRIAHNYLYFIYI